MPQITKGGKFVFGWSPICKDGCVQIPEQIIDEYHLFTEDELILISGSKSSGGFVVSRSGLIKNSIMGGLFSDHPEFENYTLPEGAPVNWKGRQYCWVKINKRGRFRLNTETLGCFKIKEGDRLLSIRGSNIGFVMAVRGPIVVRANNCTELIKEFEC